MQLSLAEITVTIWESRFIQGLESVFSLDVHDITEESKEFSHVLLAINQLPYGFMSGKVSDHQETIFLVLGVLQISQRPLEDLINLLEGVVNHTEAHRHAEEALIVDLFPEELDFLILEVLVKAPLYDLNNCVLELKVEGVVDRVILDHILQVYFANRQGDEIALENLKGKEE